MKLRRGYIPTDAAYPLMGLNTLDPPQLENRHYTPDCKNVVFNKGVVSKRRGYQYIGAVLNASGVTETVLALIEFETFDGVKTLLAITNKKQYKYDVGSAAWVNITYQAVGVDVDWTGAETDTVDWAVVTGKNGSGTYVKWVIVTNGKDQPRYWDGAASKFALFAPTGITNFKTCKTITGFFDHLLLGNITYTGGSIDHNLMVWSDQQSLVEFTETALTTAGAAILTDLKGELLQFVQLGDRLMIYSENSIIGCAFVSGSLIYSFEKILEETRLVSRRSVVNIGSFHMFLSQENITVFDGSRLIRQSADQIYRSYRDDFYAGNRYMAFSFHDVAREHVYFNFPTGTSAELFQVEYHRNDPSYSVWTRTAYLDRATCMGLLTRDSNLACNSPQLAGVPCSACHFPCSQGSIRGGFPVRVFGTATGRVALADDTIANDAAVAVESYYDTPDFTTDEANFSEYARWIEYEFEAKGFEVQIYYSTDSGVSWNELENVELTGNWIKYKRPIDFMAGKFRLRFGSNCSNSAFYLRWVRCWYKPGGAA